MYKYNLYIIREERKISKKEAANIIGVDRTTYTHYENEDDIIPIKHLNTLCNNLNISLDYVFGFNSIENYPLYDTEIDLKKSGYRIKNFRKERKFILKNLGEILNCAPNTISSYESGKRIIATPFLYTICKKYHISADYLLGKIDEPKYLK